MASLHQPVWTLPVEAVYESLATTPQGLSSREAAQRLEQFGANELPTPTHRPLWLKFTDQLTHFMALLLWVAGSLAFVARTPALGWAVWAVILINAIFSFWQEFQAERALAALKQVLPVQVKVYRDRTLQQLPARELVRGDVIELEEGDRISADAMLRWSTHFTVDESPVPVRKRESSGETRLTLPGGDDLPAVFSGTLVVQGQGIAEVMATGLLTEMGKIDKLWWVLGGGVVFLGLILYVPLLQNLFRFSTLYPIDLAICVAAGVLSTLWFEVLKLWPHQRKQRIR